MSRTPITLSLIGLGMALLFVFALLFNTSNSNLTVIIGFFFLMTAAQIVALVSNIIILRKGTTGWKIFAAIYTTVIAVFFGLVVYALYDLSHTTYN